MLLEVPVGSTGVSVFFCQEDRSVFAEASESGTISGAFLSVFTWLPKPALMKYPKMVAAELRIIVSIELSTTREVS
mgnify:CR=1 FL=1